MSVYPVSKLEIELSGEGSGWTDITSDTLDPTKFYYGIRGHTPLDRLAITGLIRFNLDNFSTKGLYSPGHTNARSGFEVNDRVRFSMQADTDSVLYHKFIGKIKKIIPDVGEYGDGVTTIDAVDWMDDVGRFLIGRMALQVDKTDGQVVSAIINHVPNQPVDTDISLGRTTFTVANPVGRGGTVPPGLSGIKKAATSALGFGYIKGQASTDGSGGLFVYRDRHDRVGDSVPLAVFDDDPTSSDIMISDLQSIRDVDKIFNRIKAKVHPVSIDSDIKTLWSLDGTPEIGASDGVFDLIGVYRDSDDGYSVVGGDSIVHPLADCDYTVNSTSDGDGKNLLQNYSIIDTVMGTASDNLIRYWKFADQYDGDTNVIDEIDTDHDGYYDAVGDENGWGASFNPTGGSLDSRGVAIYLDSDDMVWDTNCTDVSMEVGSALIWFKAPDTDYFTDAVNNWIFRIVQATTPYISHHIASFATDTGVFGVTGDSNVTAIIRDTDWADEGWNQYGLTWDTDEVTTFNINGTDVGTSTDANNQDAADADILIGLNSGIGGSGNYAHFALWDSKIVASDFAAIHVSGLSTNTYWCSNTVTVGGTEVKNSFYNTFSDVGYITRCQVRGKRVKAYEPVIMESHDTDSIDSYGERHLSIDLPFQDDLDFGQDAADALLAMLKDPQTVGKRLRYVANQGSDALDYALNLEVGDSIKVKETQTSIDSDVFFINSAAYELNERILITTYDLAPDDYSGFTIDWKQLVDFEEGDTSDFDTVTSKFSDVATVATDAAQLGTYGLKIDVTTDLSGAGGDTTAIYGQLDGPDSDALISYEFRINPDGITMGSDDSFVVANAYNGATYHTHTVLGNDGTNYYIQQGYRNDAAGYAATGTKTISDSSWAKVKVCWGASTGAGNDNGYVYLFIDDELQEAIRDIDNDAASINYIRVGAVDGLDTDTYGDYYLDHFRWGIQG